MPSMVTIQDLVKATGSVRELARRIGYHHAYIARIVRGDIPASGRVMRRVKERLGVVVDPDTAPKDG